MAWQSSPVPLLVADLAASMLIAGAGYAILHPERGLQDRLAGTWLVRR